MTIWEPRLPDDLDPLEEALVRSLAALVPVRRLVGTIDPLVAATVFEAQVTSRLLDHVARWMRAELGLGYYTIASAGHEANAAVALALRPDDPALLHYRSGGFYAARASQVPGSTPVDDVLRGLLAKATEPMSGGRHKVFGSPELSIIPQTSTIGSHLPRAVGLALSFERAAGATRWPADAVVVCSFGDASLNHSTTQGALNWAARERHAGGRVPIVFVCEDNGLGISVPTPPGWVSASTSGRPNLTVAEVDGADPGAVIDATTRLADGARRGAPGFLHLHTVRYLGHAGTDVETAYRDPADVRADRERDPIVATAAALVATGDHTGQDLAGWVLDLRAEIRDRARQLALEPELATADEVVAPLVLGSIGGRPGGGADEAGRGGGVGDVSGGGAGSAPSGPVTLAQSINVALRRALEDPSTLVFGEDVGRKGGVYGVTRGLQRDFGTRQVFDTILDEQSVLGMALGASVNGLLPIPEIQYLAYLHNAEDQLRGEAASLPFFSAGQYRNPMVVRVAAFGYQRGFGGHFHNDNSVAVLRDIPGIIVALPAHPADAGPMFDRCVTAARQGGAVCVYLEPIARYHTTDLYEDGDGLWADLGSSAAPAAIGTARTHGDGRDGTILTWGNGLYLSLRAARWLEAQRGQRWRVVDLRWLLPLPVDDLIREAQSTGRVLVVDETRASGGVGEGVVAALVAGGYRGRLARIAARDSFVPLGRAAELVLVSEADIIAAAQDL